MSQGPAQTASPGSQHLPFQRTPQGYPVLWVLALCRILWFHLPPRRSHKLSCSLLWTPAHLRLQPPVISRCRHTSPDSVPSGVQLSPSIDIYTFPYYVVGTAILLKIHVCNLMQYFYTVCTENFLKCIGSLCCQRESCNITSFTLNSMY